MKPPRGSAISAGDPALRGVVSLGTNTVRLLVVRDASSGAIEIVAHEQRPTRLGEGLRTGGTLDPAAARRTLGAVEELVRLGRARGAALRAIATSALRRADDGDSFALAVATVVGSPLEIVAGEREAALSFRGATAALNGVDGRRVAVVDVGGGSTECAVGAPGPEPSRAESIEIGSVRLSEAFPALAGREGADAASEAALAARAFAASRLALLGELGPVDAVLAVAGTPATLAAVAARTGVAEVDGVPLTRATVDGVVTALLAMPLRERRELPGMLPQRADILPAGGIVLSEALRLLGRDEARVESRDLLLGYLLSTAAGLVDAPGAPGFERSAAAAPTPG